MMADDGNGGDDHKKVRPAAVRCVQCGYDLSGTFIGGRCPECGTPAQASIDALIPKDDAGPPGNAAATAALWCGVLSFCVPPLSVAAIWLAIRARRQIDRGSYRPSARLCADLGLILGCIGAVVLVGWLLAMLR